MRSFNVCVIHSLTPTLNHFHTICCESVTDLPGYLPAGPDWWCFSIWIFQMIVCWFGAEQVQRAQLEVWGSLLIKTSVNETEVLLVSTDASHRQTSLLVLHLSQVRSLMKTVRGGWKEKVELDLNVSWWCCAKVIKTFSHILTQIIFHSLVPNECTVKLDDYYYYYYYVCVFIRFHPCFTFYLSVFWEAITLYYSLFSPILQFTSKSFHISSDTSTPFS